LLRIFSSFLAHKSYNENNFLSQPSELTEASFFQDSPKISFYREQKISAPYFHSVQPLRYTKQPE